jgi:hypothetical protein
MSRTSEPVVWLPPLDEVVRWSGCRAACAPACGPGSHIGSSGEVLRQFVNESASAHSGVMGGIGARSDRSAEVAPHA